MEYRINPKNGDKLSILGYGCLRYTKKGAVIDQAKAEKKWPALLLWESIILTPLMFTVVVKQL